MVLRPLVTFGGFSPTPAIAAPFPVVGRSPPRIPLSFRQTADAVSPFPRVSLAWPRARCSVRSVPLLLAIVLFGIRRSAAAEFAACRLASRRSHRPDVQQARSAAPGRLSSFTGRSKVIVRAAERSRRSPWSACSSSRLGGIVGRQLCPSFRRHGCADVPTCRCWSWRTIRSSSASPRSADRRRDGADRRRPWCGRRAAATSATTARASAWP